MDAIKKKMQSLKSETENALARAAQLDAEAKESTKRAEKTEEHVSQSKIHLTWSLPRTWDHCFKFVTRMQRFFRVAQEDSQQS